jgi:hypothetical protein
MGIESAIIASNFVECNSILGYHFDTFGYIKIDHKDAIRKFNNAGKQLNLLEIGDSLIV